MLINFAEHLEKLNKVRKGETREALKVGLEEFDSKFRFVHGNLNIILGHANVGKTHFILYLMLLYSKKHKLKWLVFSSENEPYTLIRKLVEFLEGEPINKINEDRYKPHVDFVYNHFKFIDCNRQYTYKEIIELATSIKNAWDYDGMLLDPFNSLRKKIPPGSNAYEYSYESLTDMRIFCKKFNISLWVNTHAVTEALRKKHHKGHDYEGQPIPPMMGDSEMGGMFGNRSDDYLIIHRYLYDQKNWMYTRLYIAKVKHQELGYKPTSIEAPLLFKSIPNNVGFEIAGKNLLC
jgi:hypothetical protein